jgi:hypothetical protein
MKKRVLQDRLLGCLAHMPIMTIIWVIYALTYDVSLTSIIKVCTNYHVSNISQLPIMPLFLTLLSIPVSLLLLRLSKPFAFASNNVLAAYYFNIWLLRYYGAAFSIALVAFFLKIQWLVCTGIVFAFLISTVSLMQSFVGLVQAARGDVFDYWYPHVRRRLRRKKKN